MLTRNAMTGAAVLTLALGAGAFGLGLAVGEDLQDTPTTLEQAQPEGLAPAFGNGQAHTEQLEPWQSQGQRGAESGSGVAPATDEQVSGLVRIQTDLYYGRGEAAGTGMILSSDGIVVTNHHVVDGATEIEATDRATGHTYQAELVGADPAQDIAVLRLVDASGLDTVDTDPSGVSVGDQVTSVGDAGGHQDQFTAAPGTVTALGETITTQDSAVTEGATLKGLIKTSSDVYPGDSGGATYDAHGKVIGMTTAASMQQQEVDGYAIPIRTVLSVARDLLTGVQGDGYQYGYPAFLGVGLADGAGTVVQEVYDDSPAAAAGLAPGDTVTSVDGKRVRSATGLVRAIGAHEPGDQVRIGWRDRSGEAHQQTVDLAEGPVD